VWQKVVRDPKLLLLVLVVFFLVVFIWDRGFDPEGIFVPPDLEPGVEFIDHRESENFSLGMDLFIEEKGEDFYDFNWVLEVETGLNYDEVEIYGMLPLEIEDHYSGEEIFPTWLRQEEKGDLLLEESRLLYIEDRSKERIVDLAGWVKVIIFWEEGEEYLEIKIP